MIWAAATLALVKAWADGGASNRDLRTGETILIGESVTVARLYRSSTTTPLGMAVSLPPGVRRAVPAISYMRICLYVGSHHSYFILASGGSILSKISLER